MSELDGTGIVTAIAGRLAEQSATVAKEDVQ
jgi:hypothetical protein